MSKNVPCPFCAAGVGEDCNVAETFALARGVVGTRAARRSHPERVRAADEREASFAKLTKPQRALWLYLLAKPGGVNPRARGVADALAALGFLQSTGPGAWKAVRP